MQIESILIFIAFVVISSFANKRKEAQYKQRQQQKRDSQTQMTQVQTKTTQTKQQKPGKRTLQDLFREMQQEMETEYKKATEMTQVRKKQAEPITLNKDTASAPVTYESTKKKPVTPTLVNKKSPIYKDEIKDKSIEVGFDMTEEAILNGIIFSEVIGKPKAMRS